MFVKTWMAEQLYRFKGKLYRRLVDDVTNDFKKLDLIYIAKINNVDKLSVPSAQYKLLALSKNLKSFDKLDHLISETEITRLTDSFGALKKSLYKYEAKLRKVANSETDVIKTPDDIKSGIYNHTKKTLSLT
jgi:hypothetical protein